MQGYRFATGTWIYGTVGDRYILSGYRKGLTVTETIKKISDIEGISGIEMIYPGDFESGVDAVGELLNLSGLDCAVVGVDLTGDPVWRFGSFSSPDPGVRKRAINLAKETVDAASALGAEAINIWPGEDGHDYPFQVDYASSWERFRECIWDVASYRPDIKICLEYKPREPRTRSLIATAAQATLMCREINAPNVGVTIDVGHALQAGENISESVSFLAQRGVLYHVHLNDNYGGWDDDMAVGSVRLMEFLEMLYYLEHFRYEGWLSIDVYPYREDPARVVGASLSCLRGLSELLERIGVGEITRNLKGNDPMPLISRIQNALFSTGG